MRAVLIFLSILVTFPVSVIAQPPALLLLGDDDSRTFLGCLSCDEFETDSICNEFGRYGSEFSSDSIWNEFSSWGSEFSSSSPWNEFASGAPVIVDRKGGFYGRFTVNEFDANQTRIESLRQFLRLAKIIKKRDAIRTALCGE